jgi:hypothetical protein
VRTPIIKFAEQRKLSIRFLYNEAAAGRLVLTKVGSRTFIDDADAESWDALAQKVTGSAGDKALQIVEQRIEELGLQVAAGRLDRRKVIDRLGAVAVKAGLGLPIS